MLENRLFQSMQAQVENTLIDIVTGLIAPLGYEVVHVEVQTHRQKTLRLFIDFSTTPVPDEKGETPGIGIEDCVKVARALDEPLDLVPEIEGIFRGAYELEVSSPGVDRPLRQKKDFERFVGRQIRLHTFRALSADEMGNAEYFAHNTKQKNFIGELRGLSGERVLLAIGQLESPGSKKKKGNAKARTSPEKARTEIMIPFTLISKANLEPIFDFEE
jgi:ribosome maturation factor RimP